MLLTRSFHVLLVALCALSACLWAAPSCLDDPHQPQCARFTLPTERVEADIKSACDDMPGMLACSVVKMCRTLPHRISPGIFYFNIFSCPFVPCHGFGSEGGVYCSPFSLLIGVCTGMEMMGACHDYAKLCSNTSIVAQCKTPSLPLPASSQIKQDVLSICADMWMDGCEQCVAANRTYQKCDVFKVYLNLCAAMPNMQQCADWSAVCAHVPQWDVCGGSVGGGAPPEMRMYWHTGIADYILFKGWVPRTSLQYSLTLVACFAFAVVYEAFKAFAGFLENKWTVESNTGVNGQSDPLLSEMVRYTVPPFAPARDFLRATMHFISIGLHYWTMLLAMTFNVGVFFAVLFGHMVGYFAFGRFSRIVREAEANCCD